MNLDALEKRLDTVFAERKDYVVSAREDYYRLLSIQSNEHNSEQYLRVCRKLTWLMVFPLDHSDGQWESF